MRNHMHVQLDARPLQSPGGASSVSFASTGAAALLAVSEEVSCVAAGALALAASPRAAGSCALPAEEDSYSKLLLLFRAGPISGRLGRRRGSHNELLGDGFHSMASPSTATAPCRRAKTILQHAGHTSHISQAEGGKANQNQDWRGGITIASASRVLPGSAKKTEGAWACSPGLLSGWQSPAM